MAPEQITGGDTDARTDVYALGCVFFQMLTGKVPYERENSVAKLFAHVHEPPPLDRGRARRPVPDVRRRDREGDGEGADDRYLSAGDFARDAAAALHGARYTGPPTIVATGEARPSDDAPLPPTAGPATRPAPPSPTRGPQTAGAGSPPPARPPASRRRRIRRRPCVATGASGRMTPARTRGPRHRAGAARRPSGGAGAAARQRGLWRSPLAVRDRRRWSSRRLVVERRRLEQAAAQPFEAAAHPVPTNRVTGTGRDVQ